LIADRVVGAGEFGEVYLAKQKAKMASGQKVLVKRAVKTLKGVADDVSKTLFMREAMIMVAIGAHRNVVKMVGVAVQQAPWLVVLEFVRYGDLKDIMESLRKKRISLEPSEMLDICQCIATGMEHMADRRLIHMVPTLILLYYIVLRVAF